MSTSIRFSSTTVNCPDATALAHFYAGICDGEVTFVDTSWATMRCAAGRIDFQTVENFQPPSWPDTSGMLHLDFLVDDLAAGEARVTAAGAAKFAHQPNAAHCLVFADPVGHPFCLTTVDELG